MRRGRPMTPLSLAAEERERLEEWARQPTTAQALAERSRIVLESASGCSNVAVARQLGVALVTVGRWRRRFLQRRLEGLLNQPLPVVPRQVRHAQIERLVYLTLKSQRRSSKHWTTYAMAKRCGLSQSTVSRIWRVLALQPYRTEGFKLSKAPLFIQGVRDIVGLYLRPPACALVLCVDEKSPIQMLDSSHSVLPLHLGQAEQRVPAYLRHGTSNLFAALHVKATTVIAEPHYRYRTIEFRKFLETIDHAVPAALQLHLIIENNVVHKTPATRRWLLRHPRFHLHFTPTSASWLNLVECWFAALTEKPVRRGAHQITRELEDAIRRYLDISNFHSRPFIWTKTADRIFARSFYRRVYDSGYRINKSN
jgi:transposase-like protein/transposase